jgi:hypothetical protein
LLAVPVFLGSHMLTFNLFNGRAEELKKILGDDYQLEKSFTKNQEEVYILRRILRD